MRNKVLTLGMTLLIILIWSSQAFSLKEDTHKAINEYIAQTTVNGFSLKSHIMNNLGFKNGFNENLKGYDADGKDISKKVFQWLGYGGIQEDRPGAIIDYVTQKPTRSFNHFHNPIKPSWNEAGLNDYILVPIVAPIPPFPVIGYTKKWYTGQSSILWSQNSQQSVGGQWSWSNARKYFYDALTLKVKNQRDRNFADTFRAVGQLMHLVHDSSVPEHVRNDIHVLPSFGDSYPAYEQQVEDFRSDKINYGTFWNNLVSNPISFDKSVLDIPSSNASAPVSISRIIDTDLYAGKNPGITATSPGSVQKIGLSEYANANFVSKDTMFEDESPHGFSYPRVEDLAWWIDVDKWYLMKEGNGETIRHFLRTSWLYWYRWKLFPQYKQYLPVGQDKECFKDYAQNLIPRAVGYSAGLLNYFFRGDIRLEYVTSPQPGYVIVNKTSEKLDGDFRIYYDNRNNERHLLWNGIGNLEAVMNDKTNPFDFILPDDAKEPGKYILVFKGNMGNEKGAVAGYVNSRVLEITPPSQYIYSMADGSEADPYFTRIRAKVKNASPGEQMRSGTVQAVAKYKADTYDAGFIYSISEPRAIDLSSNAPVEVEFNFDNDPIPADVTDLNLEIVFKGTIGSEANAMAFGIKDISEPTPIDVFNNTDKSCINGSWYSTAEAIALMDTDEDHIADKWDVNPHILQDIYVKISSMENPQNASPSVYNAVVPFLYPGEFKRVMYILTDHNFKYSFYETWTWDPGYTDYWQHGAKLGTYNGTAVKNQTDFTSDPAVCGSDPWCYIYRYPVYYFLRDNETWWGGGLVYINWPYPYNSSCQGY